MAQLLDRDFGEEHMMETFFEKNCSKEARLTCQIDIRKLRMTIWQVNLASEDHFRT